VSILSKIADEAAAMILNAAGQLSREIAPYKSGIYFRRRHDKIHNDLLIWPKYYEYNPEDISPCHHIDLRHIESVEDAEKIIDGMIQRCAAHVAYSRSEKVQDQRRRDRIRAIFFCTIFGWPFVLVLYLLFR
jgi:hypothetical protein